MSEKPAAGQLDPAAGDPKFGRSAVHYVILQGCSRPGLCKCCWSFGWSARCGQAWLGNSSCLGFRRTQLIASAFYRARFSRFASGRRSTIGVSSQSLHRGQFHGCDRDHCLRQRIRICERSDHDLKRKCGRASIVVRVHAAETLARRCASLLTFRKGQRVRQHEPQTPSQTLPPRSKVVPYIALSDWPA